MELGIIAILLTFLQLYGRYSVNKTVRNVALGNPAKLKSFRLKW